MMPVQVDIAMKGLILKTSVITGWQMPDDDAYIAVFKDQLVKMMVESYPDVNADEMEYAMRTYGTRVKDWGKAINLSLIREALDEYLSHRRAVSEMEATAPKAPVIPPGPADWSEDWERLKEKLKAGQDPIITTAIYDWMDREGMINLTIEEKNAYMLRARSKMITDLENEKLADPRNAKIRAQLEVLHCDDWASDSKVKGKLINRAKVEILKDLALKS